jgi:hypothetical protein
LVGGIERRLWSFGSGHFETKSMYLKKMNCLIDLKMASKRIYLLLYRDFATDEL